MSKKHMGSSIDDFLKEEGVFEEAQAQAVKGVVAWQLAEAMKKQKISKNKMAALLKTSRTQVDRLLDPKNDITLSSLQRAAAIVGRRVTIELVSNHREQPTTMTKPAFKVCPLRSPRRLRGHGGLKKLYEVLPDPKAAKEGYLRIVDESGPRTTCTPRNGSLRLHGHRPALRIHNTALVRLGNSREAIDALQHVRHHDLVLLSAAQSRLDRNLARVWDGPLKPMPEGDSPAWRHRDTEELK